MLTHTLLARRLAAITQNGSRRLRGLRRFPEGERPGREDRRIVRSLVSESEEVKASFVAVCNPIEKLDFSPFLHALVIQSAIDPLFSLSVAGKPIMMVLQAAHKGILFVCLFVGPQAKSAIVPLSSH